MVAHDRRDDGVPGAEVQDPLDGAPDVGSAVDEVAEEDDGERGHSGSRPRRARSRSPASPWRSAGVRWILGTGRPYRGTGGPRVVGQAARHPIRSGRWGAEGQAMRKIVYSVAMSLDGYVAGPNGEADWITMDPEIDFAALFARFDTVLMGRKTYEQVKAMGGGEAMPGVTSIVASRTLKPEDCPGATVIGDGLTDRVRELRAGSGKDIWLFGGGVLFRSLLDAGLVDEVGVAVMPVLLGGGVPLLAAGDRAKLRLTGNKVYKSGIASLEYAVEADRAKG